MTSAFFRFTFTLSLLISSNVWAHGEDRPGPHGGFIRMPGAFHTEVVKVKNGFRIYLLDHNWKNPTVQNSSVTSFIKPSTDTAHIECKKEKLTFFCPTSIIPEKGELHILAQRDGQSGAPAIYPLPLRLEGKAETTQEHNSHHHH